MIELELPMNIIGPILFFLFSQFITPSMDVDSANTKQLASEQISLEKRYDNLYVNDVFKDNILLNVAYLSGKVTKKEDVNWKEIEKPINYKFTLLPNKTFAFHEDVLEKYKNRLGGKIGVFKMPAETACDIDEEIDWIIVEQLLHRKKKR